MAAVEGRPVASEFSVARKAMIDSQLRVSGVNAGFVLERMGSVAREDFVPEAAREIAYMDRAIALGDGRHLAAPLVHGQMLEAAAPTAEDKVLLVDGGSGYMAELLRPLAGSLETVSPEMALEKSRKKGDFTLLVIDGAVEEIPETLARRVAEDGRIVTGLVTRGLTRLAVGRKIAGEIALIPLADIGIPILPEFAAKKGWSF